MILGLILSMFTLPLLMAKIPFSLDSPDSLHNIIESNAKTPNLDLNKRLRDIIEDMVRFKYI